MCTIFVWGLKYQQLDLIAFYLINSRSYVKTRIDKIDVK